MPYRICTIIQNSNKLTIVRTQSTSATKAYCIISVSYIRENKHPSTEHDNKVPHKYQCNIQQTDTMLQAMQKAKKRGRRSLPKTLAPVYNITLHKMQNSYPPIFLEKNFIFLWQCKREGRMPIRYCMHYNRLSISDIARLHNCSESTVYREKKRICSTLLSKYLRLESKNENTTGVVIITLTIDGLFIKTD